MEIVVHRMTTAEPGLSGTVLCVKQLVVKVLNLSPLNYCNFRHCLSLLFCHCHPLLTQWPVFIVFHLY